MAYNTRIENRIRGTASRWKKIDSKKMFGGVCFLLGGKMFCGVYRDFLILRLGEKGASEALRSDHARPFDITGKPMKGWIMIQESGFRTDEELAALLEEARDFVKTL